MGNDWFNTHAHSGYSCQDAMGSVGEMVEKAAQRGQQGLGLTDHGVMSGVLELYRSCKREGIASFPGEEFYLVSDVGDKDAPRHHVCLLALNLRGYQGLVRLSSLSHLRENYHRKPRIDWRMLAELSSDCKDDIAVLTGCYFGLPIQQLVQGDSRGAEATVKTYGRLFTHTYVELQHHNTLHGDSWTDDKIVMEMAAIARRAGLPTIITQDAHYWFQGHKPLHDALKRMVIHGEDADDGIFPGDSYHLASAKWVKTHYQGGGLSRVWRDSLDSNRELLALNKLSLPALDTYKFYVPQVHRTPGKRVRQLCISAMIRAGWWNKRAYRQRLEEELDVLDATGFHDYLLLIRKLVRFCHSNKIMVAARGSANASLVNMLLGITDIDPIYWALPFERFLTKDRKKPPDIDLDLEDTKRADLIGFASSLFNVVQIGTYSSYGLDQFGRGSIFVQYMGWLRRKYGDGFQARYGQVQSIDDLPEEDANLLVELSQQVLRRQPGAHAAGFLIEASELPISDYVPTMLIPSSNTTVTQVTMNEVESAGYIKADFLGQRTLTTIKRCQELMGRDDPTDLSWIPLNDGPTLSFIRKGIVDNAVFQFEGWATANGVRQLKPSTVRECIHSVALFRPAPMQSGDTEKYIKRKHGQMPPAKLNPFMEKALGDTRGVFIFQEQVLALFKELGMTVAERNDFLSAIKASSGVRAEEARKLFGGYQSKFVSYCVSAGWSQAEADRVWDEVRTFSSYAFNKAHATKYGLLGYQCAYLHTHHPLEFMAAVLETTAGSPKETKYVLEARRTGIRLLPPDVNVSGALWTIDRRRSAIRKGLSSIKGVGVAAATEIAANAPYSSVQDLIDRTSSRAVTGGKAWPNGPLNGVMAALQNAGALSSIHTPRQ